MDDLSKPFLLRLLDEGAEGKLQIWPHATSRHTKERRPGSIIACQLMRGQLGLIKFLIGYLRNVECARNYVLQLASLPNLNFEGELEAQLKNNSLFSS
mmetsp:Transcript_11838/g.16986  ORF Transcript_11838/g.16986 Transcript_11838/m.16986 type:complete len:98 (+) Transcript_11838:235-528(+)